MFKSKELLVMLIAVIFLAFSNSFLNLSVFLISLLFFAIIVLIYVFGKKFMASYLDCETEEKIWTLQRYGFREHNYYKTPIPLGLLLSFFLPIISLGYLKWFALTETEISTTPARAARKHDFYSYSELTEWHIALISSAGIFCLILFSFIAYLFNFSELAKLAVYFAAFNMIPFGKLDGTKVFFGSMILYFTLLAIVLIALGYAFLLV